MGRPPRGGVDRNMIQDYRASQTQRVAPHAGAWIETFLYSDFYDWGFGRPPRGGVDRNKPG